MKGMLLAAPIAMCLGLLMVVQVGAESDPDPLELVPPEQIPVNQLRAAPRDTLISKAEAIAIGKRVATGYGDSEATLHTAEPYAYGTARTQVRGWGLDLSVGEDRQVFLVSFTGEFESLRAPPSESGFRPRGTLLYVMVDAPTGDILSVKLTYP